MTDLVERLKAKRYTRTDWHEPYGEIELPCDADDDGAQGYLVNPDGPEAAAEITRLRGLVEEARGVLTDAPVLVVDAIAARMQDEREALKYARDLKAWRPRASSLLPRLK